MTSMRGRLARHIGRHLPGRPTVIAKNVPGAGGLTLANYMYNRAPADGSELATVQNGLPFEKLFQTLSPDGRNALFDATKFGWVGSITQTVFVTVTWHSAPVKTLAGCHRAAGDPRRQRDQFRQLRAGDAHQPPARYQVQGRARLSRGRRGRSRGGERRSRGRGREGLDHADLDAATMDQGQEDQHPGADWE